MSRATPLFKYNLVFFGAYFGIAFALGLIQVLGRFGMGMQTFLGLLLPPLAAYVALRVFRNDHGRGLEAGERAGLVRTQLIGLAVMTLLGTLVIRGVYNSTLLGSYRPMSMSIVLLTPIVAALLGWGQLWLVYSVLNGRYAPVAGATSPRRPAPRVRVLVLGRGAAAHALAWKLGQSSRVLEVLVAPGNGGTANELKCRNVAVALDDADAIAALARREMVKLVVLAHADGAVATRLRALGLTVAGPSVGAGDLNDTSAAGGFLRRHAVPQAAADASGADCHAIALVDADTAVLLGTLQVEGDRVQSPATPLLPGRVVTEVLLPVVAGLARDKASYGGLLTVRVRVGSDGAPRVVGLCAGLDDAHAAAWVMRLQSDLFELLDAAAENYLDAVQVRSNPRPAHARVLLATDPAHAGACVRGLATPPMGTHVFHGATRRDADGVYVDGTHVATVCALGDDAADAARRAHELAVGIEWVARDAMPA